MPSTNISGYNLNSLVSDGIYDGVNFMNAPNASQDWFYVEVLRFSANEAYAYQRAEGLLPEDGPYVRTYKSGNWTDWQRLARSTASASTIIGNGVTTIFSVTHNLGTQDIFVSILDSAKNVVIADAAAATANTATISFASAPASGTTYRAFIGG